MKRDKRTLALLAAGAAVFLGLGACTSGGAGPSGGQTAPPAGSASGGASNGAPGGGAPGGGASGGGASGGSPGSSPAPPSSLAPNPSAVPAISPTMPGPVGVTLKLTAGGLVSGGTVTPPVKVAYTVAGPRASALAIGASSGYKLRLIPGDGPAKAPLKYDVPIDAASGTVTLSPGPSFTSTHDFTFELLAPGGDVLTFVTVHRLTINGPV